MLQVPNGLEMRFMYYGLIFLNVMSRLGLRWGGGGFSSLTNKYGAGTELSAFKRSSNVLLSVPHICVFVSQTAAVRQQCKSSGVL